MAANIPTNTHYEIGSAVVTAYPVTMACWFYVPSTTLNRRAMDLGSSTVSSGQCLFLNNAGNVAWQSIVAGSGSIATSTTTYSANTWHHACGIAAGTNDRRAFLDGGGKGTEGVVSRAFAGTIDRTAIGRQIRSGTANQPLTGRIAECAIWNVALNDDEVYALGRGYRASLVRPDALVLYAPFIREVLDVAGGQSLTVVGGTPTVIEHPRRIGY